MTTSPASISTLLRRHALETPDRVAVIDATESLTFSELDRAVSGVATRIRSERSGADDRWLPIIVDRGIASLIGVVGAVRAGVRYSPVSSDLPPTRVAELLGRLGDPELVMVGHAAFGALLPATVRSVSVDDALGAPDTGDGPIDLTSLAMAVFTSGSTGHPKCVLRTWEVFDRSIDDQLELGPVSDAADWVWGGVQPLTFGGSRTLATLALGGTVAVLDASAQSSGAFIDLLHRLRVNETSLVPTLARSLVEAAGGRRRLPHLRRVLLGGEPVDASIIEPLRSLVAPDAEMLHEFGSSETGRVSIRPMLVGETLGAGRVPVGRPIGRRRVRFEPLDDRGLRRQLFVSDPDSVAYLGDDALTAQRFSRDADGILWYATGDVFGESPDGELHHVGRIDDMVKINGMLVEPLEAELALRSMPGISAAVVLPHETPSGDLRLVGHVVVEDPALTPERVRRSLEERLPRHLVPSVLVRHDHIPMSDRMKVDRAALLARSVVRWGSAPVREFADETESFVVGQVRVVLETDDVAPDDDVWTLGMDSLGAVELCTRLADAGFGEIDPPSLLTHRTPAEIARAVGTGSRRRTDARVVLNPAGSRPPIVMVPGSGGTALAFVAIAASLGADQPIVVVEAKGLHTRGLPHRTVSAMADHVVRHLPEGLGDGGFVLAGYSGGGAVACEVAVRLADRGVTPRLVLIDPAVGDALADVGPPRSARSVIGLVRSVWNRTRLVFGSAVGVVRIDASRYWWFYRTHKIAARRHRVRPLASDATVVRGMESEIAPPDLSAIATTSIVMVGGTHHSMLQPPHAAAIADVLRDAVESLA